MTRTLDQIVEDFIGSSSTADLITESYEKESEYIKWLAANFLSENYTEREVEDLYDDKYLNGAGLNIFLQNLAMTKDLSSKFYRLRYQNQDKEFETILPEEKFFTPEVFRSVNLDLFGGKDFQVAPAERLFQSYMEKSFSFAIEHNAMETKDIIVDDLHVFFDSIPASCHNIPLSEMTAVSWSDRVGQGGFVIEKDLPSAFTSILLRVQPEARIDFIPVSVKEVKKFLEKANNPSNSIGR